MTRLEMLDVFNRIIEKEINLRQTEDWKVIVPEIFCDYSISVGHVIDSYEQRIVGLENQIKHLINGES